MCRYSLYSGQSLNIIKHLHTITEFDRVKTVRSRYRFPIISFVIPSYGIKCEVMKHRLICG